MNQQAVSELAASARDPRALLRLARGNVELWANLIVLTWAAAFMLWQGVGFAITIATVFAIWAILAVSLNLVVGFTGLLSVGHIGFFGIGAYSMAILTSDTSYEQLRTGAIPTLGWPFFAALPVSIALAGLLALVVGVAFNRFRDDIFVLVSFGFAIIAFNFFLNLRGLTRGAFGIHQIERPAIGGWVLDGDFEFLVLALVCLALVVLVSWFIVTSSFGRVLTAIREDEEAIAVFGYQVTHYKLAVWVISAMMAGLAGGLFGSWTSFYRPQLLRPAGVDAAGLHRDPRRAGDDLGLAAGRDGLRAARGGHALPALPAQRVRRPGSADRARRPAGAADAVQAPGAGREVQAVSTLDAGARHSYAIETVGISKHFGAVRAVDELSISIPRTGITSIVGPNGSGKSTLVNLLSGVLPLDGGLVIIDGRGLRVVKAHETPRHGVTRTFQEVRLFDQISVRDNIMVVLTRRRLLPALLERTTPGHRARTEEILREVGMWEKRDSLAMDLSYGQRKLLEIGRAMALDVRTYLFGRAVRRPLPADAGARQGDRDPHAGPGPHADLHLAQHGHRARAAGPPDRARQRQAPHPGRGARRAQSQRSDRGVPGRLGARRRTAMTQHSASGLAGAPSTDGALLELDGVSVHYGAVVALDDVSLGIRKGEVVAVMGPNGAGKSTVLKAIMGLAPVVAGEVHWRQQRLAAATHEIVKEGIAFVPQGRRVFTHLTIEENLEMGCLYLGDAAEKARRLDAVMELFPILREKRRDMASQMSGGQQQMLALGRGLMAGPELLLLDEPTLGLAPIIVSEVFQKVREISDRLSTTIMLVEHNIRGALEIVDRAYVLDMGRVVHDGTPESIRETNILTDVFLGRVRRNDEDAEGGP